MFVAKQKTKTYYFTTIFQPGAMKFHFEYARRLQSYIMKCRKANSLEDEKLIMESLYSFLTKGTKPATHLMESAHIFVFDSWNVSTKKPVGEYEIMNVSMFDEE